MSSFSGNMYSQKQMKKGSESTLYIGCHSFTVHVVIAKNTKYLKLCRLHIMSAATGITTRCATAHSASTAQVADDLGDT